MIINSISTIVMTFLSCPLLVASRHIDHWFHCYFASLKDCFRLLRAAAFAFILAASPLDTK